MWCNVENLDFHLLVFWLVSWPVGLLTEGEHLCSLLYGYIWPEEMLCSPCPCYQCNNSGEIGDLIFGGGILVLRSTGTSGFSGSPGFSSVHPPLLLAGLSAQPHEPQARSLGSLSLTFRFPSVKSSWSLIFGTLTRTCSDYPIDSVTIPW